MSSTQIQAFKTAILGVLAALVAGGVITDNVSDVVAAVAGAALTVLAAFITSPRDA